MIRKWCLGHLGGRGESPGPVTAATGDQGEDWRMYKHTEEYLQEQSGKTAKETQWMKWNPMNEMTVNEWNENQGEKLITMNTNKLSFYSVEDR